MAGANGMNYDNWEQPKLQILKIRPRTPSGSLSLGLTRNVVWGLERLNLS